MKTAAEVSARPDDVPSAFAGRTSREFAVRGDPALQLAESAILGSLRDAPRWKAPKPPRLWLFFL